MVQLGLTESSQKGKELKKPVADSTVIVLQPTTPPSSVKTPCCTKRLIICISVACLLVAMAIAGVLLSLYINLDRCYWGGCGEFYYGDDIIYMSSAFDMLDFSSSSDDQS